jgi:dihydroneopterin aldolase
MGIINVTGIKMHAYHGCLPEESVIGGNYIVDVELHTDFDEAAQSDKLVGTIDYVDVNRIVEEEMAIRSKLIEHAGQRIVNRLKAELLTLKKVQVKVVKLNPPINGNVDNVSIIIEG